MGGSSIEILLVPGFMLDADLWRDMRGELERWGRVVDADTSRDNSIAGMAARALVQLQGPALVVGFSMGGYVAREMVYRAPDMVRALALVATSSRGDEHVPPRPPIDAAQFRQIGRAAVVKSLHPDHRSDEAIARVQAMSRRLGGAVYRNQSEARRTDDTDRLHEIRCPTLVVAAADDELRSVAESETLHAGIEGSDLVVVERSGHLVPLEQPAALLQCLRPLFGSGGAPMHRRVGSEPH